MPVFEIEYTQAVGRNPAGGTIQVPPADALCILGPRIPVRVVTPPSIAAALRKKGSAVPDAVEGHALFSETLTLVQLCTAIRDTRRGDDPRVPAALALMGLCGLGPSEAIRLNVGDLADGILRVGIQGAKNEARRRRLPLPATVRQLCLPLLDGREASAPLFVYGRLRGNSRMSLVKLAHVFAGAGVGVSPKILRKSFATIAIWELGIDTRHVEAFMGHTISGLAAVTNRAYLSLASVQALRPTALRIDDEVTKHLPDLAEHWDWSI